MLETLREDFARLPQLLALGAPSQQAPLAVAHAEPEHPPTEASEVDQLGLF
jgi:hypothetical protein